jgi:microcystin-dependent protein
MIKDIILYVVIVLLVASNIFLYIKIYKINKVENFTVNDDVKQSINDIYKADINAIRNLSNIATDIYNNNDSLTIPAKTTTMSNVIISGDVTFTNKNTGIMEIFPAGMVIAWANPTIPKGWAVCDGQIYKLDSNKVATVDSNGVQTPDLRGRFVLGSGTGTGLTSRTAGTTGGEENHKLTVSEIPSHNHGYIKTERVDGWRYDGGGYYIGQIPATSDNTGGDLPHNNMPPYYVLTYIMKL